MRYFSHFFDKIQRFAAKDFQRSKNIQPRNSSLETWKFDYFPFLNLAKNKILSLHCCDLVRLTLGMIDLPAAGSLATRHLKAVAAPRIGTGACIKPAPEYAIFAAAVASALETLWLRFIWSAHINRC